MFDANLTPEDKLLKIIESPQDHGAAAVLGGASGYGLKAWLTSIKPYQQFWVKIKLHDVTVGMMILCALLTVYCTVAFISSRVKLDSRFEQIKSGVVAEEIIKKEEVEPVVDYKKMVFLLNKKNFFSMVPPQLSEGGTVIGDTQEVAEFRLVGVMWSDKPQAMIENVSEQKTHLLSEGESIGRFKVKSVLKDRAVLEKDGQVWEIR